MEFFNNVNANCCTPTGKYELCGCVNGVSYIQLTVVGGGVVQTAWLNTETGDTFTTKPAGFLTGACSANENSLAFSATAPTATSPIAVPKDNYTVLVTSDGTAAGTILEMWKYNAETATWYKVPLGKDILWTDVTVAPTATGNPVGPRFEKLSATQLYFVDSIGRAELFKSGCTTRAKQESFTATAGQTSFTLAHTPVDEVLFSRNGAILRVAARSSSGTTVTYLPAGNNADTLNAGDAIDIFYTYEDCA